MTSAHLSHDSRDIEKSIDESVAYLRNHLAEFDAILIPGDVSGVSVGVPLALNLGIPFAIGRISEPKCWLHGSGPITDHGAPKGLRYLYVDDQISSGQTYRDTVANFRQDNTAADIVATFEYQYQDYRNL